MIVSSVGREAVMEWVVKIETKNGWGEVETIEVGKLARRPHGALAGGVWSDPDGRQEPAR